MKKLLLSIATVGLLSQPLSAGGYVAPTIPVNPIITPVDMPSIELTPVFTAVGTIALLCIIGIICEDDKHKPHELKPNPPTTPAPVPLPATGVLLIGALAFLTRRKWLNPFLDKDIPGSGWVGHDSQMPKGGYHEE